MTDISALSTPATILTPRSMRSSPAPDMQAPSSLATSTFLSSYNLVASQPFENNFKLDPGVFDMSSAQTSPLYPPDVSGAAAPAFDLMSSGSAPSLPATASMNGSDGPIPATQHDYNNYQLQASHLGDVPPSPGFAPAYIPDEQILLPSSNGFLVTTRSCQHNNPSDIPIQHVSVSWEAFLSFISSPANTSHLPLSHPIRLLSRSLQEIPLDEGRPLSSPAYPTYGLSSPVSNRSSSMSMQDYGIQTSVMPHLTSSAPAPQTVAPYNMARRVSDPAAVPRTAAMSRLSSFSNASGGSPAMFSTPSPTFPPPLQAADGGKLNAQDDHYIFSQSQGRLLRLGTKESEPEANLPDNTLITFKAGTVREAAERDGARAIPAWTPAWPGSNEWLKAQYCAPNCLYERGFGNKRPVLIREHLRKCPLLSEDHPLKVLARLELDAHARAQWLATTQRALKRKRQEEGLTE